MCHNKYIAKDCATTNNCKKLCQNTYIAKNCVITNILQVWWKIWGVHFPVWLLQGERAKEPGDVHVPPGENLHVPPGINVHVPPDDRDVHFPPVRIVWVL